MSALARRPKLIATDLDGTIVPHYSGISERTRNAFFAAHEAKIEIYYVTGRPPRWMKDIAETFPFGKGILGKKVGETAEVQAPAGTLTFRIDSITTG